MFGCSRDSVSLMDAGAGVGSLFSAAVVELASRPRKPNHILVDAYEIDSVFEPFLSKTIQLCSYFCGEQGIHFAARLLQTDFVRHFEELLFLRPAEPHYDCVILNPPYGKIRSNSQARSSLRRLGIETSNSYSGFVAVSMQLLKPGGELVAITPRSFCNGPYFKPFRKAFLRNLAVQRIHVYEARDSVFKDDDVLQENVIVHAVKSPSPPSEVQVTSSAGLMSAATDTHLLPYERMVFPDDPDSFIHLPIGGVDALLESARRLPSSLEDLGLTVSTGRVVDFRARDLLRMQPEEGTVPLIYPTHIRAKGVSWPKSGKKPNAVVNSERSADLLVPNANYVLVKRLSAKEEPRRVVACLFEAQQFPYPFVGFENHLNYIHEDGGGLDLDLARGMVAFLNSSIVDAYFRQFSGHTQVNATDLRKIRYPTREQLQSIGRELGSDGEQDRMCQAVDKLMKFANST